MHMKHVSQVLSTIQYAHALNMGVLKNLFILRTWYEGEYRRRKDGKYSACGQQEFPSNLLDILTRSTGRMLLVEKELLTLPEHLSSHPILMGFVLLDILFHVYVCLVVFFWPLCYLFSFDIRILIIPLVSRSYSYTVVSRLVRKHTKPTQ